MLGEDARLSQRFCSYPFSFARIEKNGDVNVCCPGWLRGGPIGNIFRDRPDKLWNSQAAQRVRKQILDGSFSGCRSDVCLFIRNKTLPLRRDKTGPIAKIIATNRTELATGPEVVKLAHDDSCNLSCPSCRTQVIVANAQRQAALDRMLHEFILPFMKDTKTLDLSGDGDPFASRHYRAIMRETARTNPSLRINLNTHGVLCDEDAWIDCSLFGRVDSVHVSVDAVRPKTYSLVRRGGDFQRLLSNLEFLSKLRTCGQLSNFALNFVVQRANFREMPEFVDLAVRFNVDRVLFSRILRWDRAMNEAEFAESQVWHHGHPEYREFVAVLRDPRLQHKIVKMGDLRPEPISEQARELGRRLIRSTPFVRTVLNSLRSELRA
jgi:wyosine [tRNA(Phe)-imidazoG37] synthetase (radical SAM superfamily)